MDAFLLTLCSLSLVVAPCLVAMLNRSADDFDDDVFEY